MFGRVGIGVDLSDEVLDGELQRRRRTHSVAVGVVSHPDRPAFENRLAQQPRDRFEFLEDRLEGGPLDERVDVGGCGALLDGGVDSVGRVALGVAVEDGQRVDFELAGVAVGLDLAGDANDVVDLHVGIRADAGLLEGCAADDPGAVGEMEDRRPAGLFDLDDTALDGRRRPGFEVGDGREVGFVVADLGAVLLEIGDIEGDVAVFFGLVKCDDEAVADVVRAVEVGLVNQPRNGIGDIDEDAVVDDAVDDGVVVIAGLGIGTRAVGREIVDDGTRIVP
ncbi:MAG: hypothetical protein J07HN6_01959 [Halonotius sp. J07HN6]|nr:MAG: hypothetical protein J07HN6_01959 [Halonotius sp. J07HN6]